MLHELGTDEQRNWNITHIILATDNAIGKVF